MSLETGAVEIVHYSQDLQYGNCKSSKLYLPVEQNGLNVKLQIGATCYYSDIKNLKTANMGSYKNYRNKDNLSQGQTNTYIAT